ncbi:13495_t:CDS:2, partial [Dentiscutata erythropus]
MAFLIYILKELKATTAEKQTDNEATNSALKRAQKHKLDKQATSSSVPNKIRKPIQPSHETLSRNETVNQRYEEEDTASFIGHENNGSQVSLSDNESDNGNYEDDISPPAHGNDITSPAHGNDVSSPAHGNDVSSPAHRNISSSVYENDISSPVHENNISLPNHGNDYSLPKLLIQFEKLDNEFQTALRIVHHKRILDLATNIRTGMMTRIDEVFGATSTPTLSHEPVSKFPEIDQHVKFQLQKECKALFLRTRNNSSVLYEELVVQTCKIAKTDQRLGSLIKDVGRWYNTYRYTFHTAAVKLANEFRSVNESAKELYDKLNEFVSDEVWKQLLQMHLKVIKSILIAQDKNKDTQNAIRKCDEYNIDLEIPTRLRI